MYNTHISAFANETQTVLAYMQDNIGGMWNVTTGG